jgi:hypothetical protein
MTDLEKLAREICWAGFNYPPKGGKVQYWKLITPAARESYVNTAKEFIWITQRLGPEKVKRFVPSRVPPNQTGSEHERATSGA